MRACPWYNGVELAGKLKIAEAASALGPWIATRPQDGAIIGISSEMGLLPYPVATALCGIGNPAIPALQDQVLRSKSPQLRFVPLRVLCIIDTPESKAALRDDLAHESDPGLQRMIRSAIQASGTR